MKKTLRRFVAIFILIFFMVSSINPTVFAAETNTGTEVSGVISEDTVWTKEGSPYHLVGNVFVKEGVNLTIKSGVKIVGNDINCLNVSGNIEILGSETEKVTFSNLDFLKLSSSNNVINNSIFLNTSLVFYGDSNVVGNSEFNYDYQKSRTYSSIEVWGGENTITNVTVDGGIRVNSIISINNNAYSWCKILYSKIRNINGVGISVGGNTEILDSEIYGSYHGISGNCTVKRSKIHSNKFGISTSQWLNLSDTELSNNDVGVYAGRDSVFENNSFINNNKNIDVSYAYNSSITSINAINNYWGTTSESEIQSKIDDFFDNNSKYRLDYSPFLLEPEKVPVTSVKFKSKQAYSPFLESEVLEVEVQPLNASNQKLIWSSSNPEIAQVLPNGKVVSISNGKSIITVTSEDGGFFDTCEVTIGDDNQITYDDNQQGNPRSYGDYIVWGENGNIILYNSKTKEKTLVSNNALHPSIYGDLIVYSKTIDGRNQIYSYDINSKVESKITNEYSWAENPEIYGNKIVYTAWRGGQCIVLYDLKTNSEIQISNPCYRVSPPKIHGNKIVWHDYGSGSDGLFVYTISTGEIEKIAGADDQVQKYDIYGNTITYISYKDAMVKLNIYDMTDKKTKQIDLNSSDIYNSVSIYKNKIAWFSSQGIKLYDLENDSLTNVTGTKSAYSYGSEANEVDIFGDKIVWVDWRSSYIGDIHFVNIPTSTNGGFLLYSVGDINDSEINLKGEAEAGTFIQVKSGTTVIGRGVTDENSIFDISIPKQKAGTKLTVEAFDDTGIKSNPIEIVVKDATGPDAPHVNEVADNSLVVTGTSEPGATVKVYSYFGIEGSGVANEQGEFSIHLIRKQIAGTSLTVVATDSDGNIGTGNYVTVVDKTAPQISVGTQTDQSTYVVGYADPGSTITVKVNDIVIATGSNPGQYIFAIPIPLQKPGTKLYIYATDSLGNTSEPEIATVIDVTTPEKPIVHEVTDKSNSVTGFAEGGSTISIKNDTTVIGLGTADMDGKFNVPIQKQNAGTELEIYATDDSGNKSESTKATVQDLTSPVVPQVDLVTDKSLVISGNTEPSAVIKVKTKGVTIASSYANENGQFSVYISRQVANTILDITATDSSGNESEPMKVTVQDVTSPSTPVVNSVTNNSTFITGFAEIGSTVICESGSTVIGSAITNQQGEFIISITKQLAGTKLTIKSIDSAENISDGTDVFVVDDNLYTITFNSKGGTEVAAKETNYNKLVTEPTEPTKSGYTFAGWYKEPTYTNEWNFGLDKITSDTVLYAKWNINAYDVTFNSQSGTAIASKGANYNTLITEPTEPTKPGYTFVGWYKEPTYTNEWNFGLDKVTSDTVLYAKWMINDYTVSFNSQGETTVATKETNYNTLIIEPTEPTKLGYTFAGWYKEPAYTNEWNFGIDRVTSDTVLYAKWTINAYTVSFNSKGGTAVASKGANYNTLITEPTEPTKSGYTFAGWYKEPTYTNEWNFGIDRVTTDTTLYAKWTINDYTVSFNSQGGTAVTAKGTSYNTLITEPTEPTKPGYTFAGWYKESTYTNEWNFGLDKVTNDTVLYAKWNINSHTVTFNSQGGTAVASKTANHNMLITEPTEPTKPGYTFAGWYKEAGYVNEWNFATDKVTEDTMLYAKWTINKYSVSFNSQGGSAVSNQNTDYNTSIMEPSVPTRTGYKFSGWYTAASGGTKVVFPYVVIDNITLYAQWTDIAPTSPTGLTAKSSSYNSNKLTWSAVTGASGYEVYRATSSTGAYTLLTSTTALSYTNTGLTTNSTYYYKIRAYRTVGTTKVYSGYSTIVSAKPIPSVPANLAVKRISSTSTKLTWSSVTGASGYEVYRATSSTGTYTLLTSTTSLGYTNTGLKANTTYYYKIRAYRIVGNTKVYSGYTTVVFVK